MRKSILDPISYLRGPVLAIWFVFHTLACAITVFFLAVVIRNRKLDDWAMRNLWARPIVWLSGVDVEVRGGERLPEKGFLYLFNHTSYFDIFVMFGYLPRAMRFGAKIELFSIPIFGQAMRSVGILPIVRENRNAVLKVYEEAISRVEKGECFALAPEGTRQNSEELGRFKTGPFIFAMSAKMPVVPVVIAGAREVWPKGQAFFNLGRWRRKIIMQVLDPIESSGYAEEEMRKFIEVVRGQMEVQYEKIKADLKLIQA